MNQMMTLPISVSGKLKLLEVIGGTYFLNCPESPNKMWLFSKKHVKTRWLIRMVGLKTIETFCKVILLNLSLSITWLIWTKIHVSNALF